MFGFNRASVLTVSLFKILILDKIFKMFGLSFNNLSSMLYYSRDIKDLSILQFCCLEVWGLFIENHDVSHIDHYDIGIHEPGVLASDDSKDNYIGCVKSHIESDFWNSCLLVHVHQGSIVETLNQKHSQKDLCKVQNMVNLLPCKEVIHDVNVSVSWRVDWQRVVKELKSPGDPTENWGEKVNPKTKTYQPKLDINKHKSFLHDEANS